MRRLLYLLARLYPRPWRARYGDEFEALLEDIEPRWSDVWNLVSNGLLARSTMMKAWQWITLGAFTGLAVHAGIFATHSRGVYTSQAGIAFRGLPPDEMNRQANELFQRVLTRQNLLQIMRTRGLYSNDLAAGDARASGAVDDFSKAISIRPVALETFTNPYLKDHPTGNATGVEISARGPDANRAQQIVRDVMTLAIDENVRKRSEAARREGMPVVARAPKPTTVEVVDLPSHGIRSLDWRSSYWILVVGTLAGAVGGMLIVLALKGWRKFAKS